MFTLEGFLFDLNLDFHLKDDYTILNLCKFAAYYKIIN